MEYVLSQYADAQFIDIYLYGLKQFGFVQAEAYSQDLIDGFQTLTRHPEIGKRLPRKGYRELRQIRWGSHLIVYRVLDDEIQIITLPHKAMEIYKQINMAIFQ